MSTQARSALVECHGPECKQVGNKWEFHHGKFCSNECELRRQGRSKIAKNLKFDHTTCFTCFTELKELEPAKPEEHFTVSGATLTYDAEEDQITCTRYSQDVTKKCTTAFQYRTPESEIGEKDRPGGIGMGTICGVCGTTNHTTHTPMLTDVETTVKGLSDFLKAEEVDFFEDTLRTVYEDTRDVELAVGKALK